MSDIVFAFARMNPPTLGHRKLVNKVADLAEELGFFGEVIISRTAGNAKNPLPVDKKIDYVKEIVGLHRVFYQVATPEVPTLMHWLKRYYEDGTRNVVVVCGDDRVEEYRGLLEKYSGKEFEFDHWMVVSSGPRDGNEISATAVRKMVADGDYRSFVDAYPGISDVTLLHLWRDLDRNRIGETFSINTPHGESGLWSYLKPEGGEGSRRT